MRESKQRCEAGSRVDGSWFGRVEFVIGLIAPLFHPCYLIVLIKCKNVKKLLQDLEELFCCAMKVLRTWDDVRVGIMEGE